MIAATIACAIGLAVLLAGEATHRDRLRYPGKALASAAFLVVAAIATRGDAFSHWIVVGLVLGAIGDLALLDSRGFLIGLVAFLCGHLAYIAGVAHVIPPAGWLGAAGALALIPAAISIAALALLWPTLARMRIWVIAYVVVITAMVIAAIAMARLGATTRAHRFCAGAVLFFASDLAVARDKFVAPVFANKAFGLPAYYAGQLLVAWSLA